MPSLEGRHPRLTEGNVSSMCVFLTLGGASCLVYLLESEMNKALGVGVLSLMLLSLVVSPAEAAHISHHPTRRQW